MTERLWSHLLPWCYLNSGDTTCKPDCHTNLNMCVSLTLVLQERKTEGFMGKRRQIRPQCHSAAAAWVSSSLFTSVFSLTQMLFCLHLLVTDCNYTQTTTNRIQIIILISFMTFWYCSHMCDPHASTVLLHIYCVWLVVCSLSLVTMDTDLLNKTELNVRATMRSAQLWIIT